MGDDLTEALDTFLARHEKELIDFRRDLHANPERAYAERRTTRRDAVTETSQSLGGEDFAWYLHLVPGAMARLGTRTPGTLTAGDLHQPTFDIDERAIGIGIRVLAAVAAWGDDPPAPSAG